jgi:hypothetical protein
MKEENKKHYVYGLYKKNVEYLTNRIDEHLFYVGITSVSIENRAKDHKRDRVANKIKLNIINKYDFEIKSLYVCDTRIEAEEREEFLIRWFGKIMDDGILANVLDSVSDQIYRYKTEETSIKISKSNKQRFLNHEERIKIRDKNLTIPYDQVIEYIEEWAKDPFQKQSEFAKTIGVSRSKFKDWIRLYKPEYVGLVHNAKMDALKFAIKHFNSVKEIVEFISNKVGISISKANSFYKRNKNKCIFDKNSLKGSVKTLEYKIFHVYKWIISNLSKNKYSKQNNIDRTALSDWIKKYQNKGFKNENNLPIIRTPYDWVWKTKPKSTIS